MKKKHYWVTTTHQGEFRTLHVNNASTMESSHEDDIFGDKMERTKIENICNLLKVMVLASYPDAEKNHWYENGEYKLPEEYKGLISKIKDVINVQINKG